jgi:hypothetical protein
VTQFRMTVAGREIEGILEERGQAREHYEEAIAQGERAAIAEEDRPGVFNLRVGNLMPVSRASGWLDRRARDRCWRDGPPRDGAGRCPREPGDRRRLGPRSNTPARGSLRGPRRRPGVPGEGDRGALPQIPGPPGEREADQPMGHVVALRLAESRLCHHEGPAGVTGPDPDKGAAGATGPDPRKSLPGRWPGCFLRPPSETGPSTITWSRPESGTHEMPPTSWPGSPTPSSASTYWASSMGNFHLGGS